MKQLILLLLLLSDVVFSLLLYLVVQVHFYVVFLVLLVRVRLKVVVPSSFDIGQPLRLFKQVLLALTFSFIEFLVVVIKFLHHFLKSFHTVLHLSGGPSPEASNQP